MDETKWWQLLRRSASGVAVVAAVFVLTLLVLVVVSLLRRSSTDLLESQSMDNLISRLETAQGDTELRESIRTFDVVARRAYFTARGQLRLASFLLFAGAGVLVLCLRLSGVGRGRPRIPSPDTTWRQSEGTASAIRWALGGVGLAVAVAVGVIAATADSGTTTPAASAVEPSVQDTAVPILVYEPGSWPGFRGPGGLGVSPDGDPPAEWDAGTARNLRWRVGLDLPGFGSPVVWGDRVFVTGADGDTRVVAGYDAGSGELVWRREITGVPGSPADAPAVTDDTGYAAPSPAVDGETVVALFANGDLAGMDLGGYLIWTRNMGIPENPYGHASSPLLAGGLVFLQYDDRRAGLLYALDARSGNTVWLVERDNEAAWSSPVLTWTGRRNELILNGMPTISSYDPRSGTPLWSVEGMMGEIACSPAYADGIAVVANDFAFGVGIEVESGEIRWEVYDGLPDVSSPIASNGLVFMAAGWGAVTCFDLETGEVRWTHEYDEGFYSSPVVASNRLYVTDRSGRTRVLAAGPEWKVQGEGSIGEPTDSTPAVSGSRIYFRSATGLFCFEGEGDGRK